MQCIYSRSNENPGVLPGCANQTGETDQGQEATAPGSCLYGVQPSGLNCIQTFQSDTIKYEMTDSMTRDHGYYSREVRGQWNYENTVYHHVGLPPDRETSDQIHYLMAGQTGALCDKVEMPHVSDHPVGVGQDGNYGYEGHRVHPIQQHPVSVRPCNADQGMTDRYYENQTQNNLIWIAKPERRENPYLYTENLDPITDRSFDLGFRASLYEASNGADWNGESLYWRSNAQHLNPMDVTLDLSVKSRTTSQFSSGQGVMPDNQIQYPNHFGNFSASAGTANYYADPAIETHDGRLGAEDWDSFNLTLDLSMKRRATNQLSSGYNTAVLSNQTQYGNSFGNFPGFPGISNANNETQDWRVGAENLNSTDITLDLSMKRQATNQFPSGHNDDQLQNADSFVNLLGPSATANYAESNMETVDWRVLAEDWNLLDIPLNLSSAATEPGTDPVASDSNESTVHYSYSLENVRGPSGTVDLEIASQPSSPEIPVHLPIKRRKKRRGTAAPAEDVPPPPPLTKSEQRQQIRENELLASFRPILPKPSNVQSRTMKQTDEEDPAEMRKRWHGWKCCSLTFDDYNLYKHHVGSTHTDPALTATGKSTAKTTPRKKTVPSKPKAAVVCPFCSTSHDDLGTDIRIETHWNGTDCLLCPLCSKVYETLRQLKIHFCTHFEVNVDENEKPLCCRYCDKEFTKDSGLRVHEAVCKNDHAEWQDSEEKEEEEDTQSTEKIVKSTASRKIASRKTASRKAESPAAKASASATVPAVFFAAARAGRAAAKKSMVTSSKSAASATASEAGTTKSPSSAASSVTAAQTSSAARKSPAKPDERLFYCPECGKLYTWEASVRRHLQIYHGTDRKKVGRPRSSKENQTNLTTENHSQTLTAAAAKSPVPRALSDTSEENSEA